MAPHRTLRGGSRTQPYTPSPSTRQHSLLGASARSLDHRSTSGTIGSVTLGAGNIQLMPLHESESSQQACRATNGMGTDHNSQSDGAGQQMPQSVCNCAEGGREAATMEIRRYEGTTAGGNNMIPGRISTEEAVEYTVSEGPSAHWAEHWVRLIIHRGVDARESVSFPLFPFSPSHPPSSSRPSVLIPFFILLDSYT